LALKVIWPWAFRPVCSSAVTVRENPNEAWKWKPSASWTVPANGCTRTLPHGTSSVRAPLMVPVRTTWSAAVFKVRLVSNRSSHRPPSVRVVSFHPMVAAPRRRPPRSTAALPLRVRCCASTAPARLPRAVSTVLRGNRSRCPDSVAWSAARVASPVNTGLPKTERVLSPVTRAAPEPPVFVSTNGGGAWTVPAPGGVHEVWLAVPSKPDGPRSRTTLPEPSSSGQ
jgi:hypothetical protein